MSTWDDGRGQYLNDDGTPDTGGDPNSAFAPVKKPAPGAAPGIPLDTTTQPASPGVPLGNGPGAGVAQAEMNSPDPMAFAPPPGAPITPPITPPAQPPPRIAPPDGPANTTPVPNVPPLTVQPPPPGPTMSTADWVNYSPIQAATAGLTGEAKEKAISAYWEGQGVQGLTRTGAAASPNSASVWTPSAVGDGVSVATSGPMAGDADIASITKQVQGGQADALAATNRGNQTINRDTALRDAQANVAGVAGAGGVFADKIPAGTTYGPAFTAGLPTTQSYIDDYMKNAGYGPGGTPPGGWATSGPTSGVVNTGGRPAPPSGPASGATPGAPSGTGTLPPVAPPAAPGAPAPPPVAPGAPAAPSATAGPNNGVSLSDINPDDSLIGKQISPGHNVDRVKTFQDSLNSTITNVLDPAMQARMRDLNRYNFGAGRGVSGIARTSQGDVASDYSRQIADLTAQGLAGATTGSIGDYYRNVDESQQERGYQADRSDTAFDQAVRGTELEDYLTNSAFGRAERQSNAGEAGNPSDIAKWMSINYGMQAGDAMKAASQIFAAMGKRAGEGGGVSMEDAVKMAQRIWGTPRTTSSGTEEYIDDTSDRSRVNV